MVSFSPMPPMFCTTVFGVDGILRDRNSPTFGVATTRNGGGTRVPGSSGGAPLAR
jgi:hypothetical protein